MMTSAKIKSNFKKDITLKSWRKKGNADGALELKGEKLALLKYFTGLAKGYYRARGKQLKKIRSLRALEKHGKTVRKAILQMQGLDPLPKRTQLNPVVTGYFYNGDKFKVEKLYFESRPGFYVTANFYIPLNVMPPYPALLFCQGHAPNGKALTKYQEYCAILASNGIAVLNIDPAGQGERDEYVDIKSGKRTIMRACRAHGVAGDPMYLTGSNFGGYRLWDAVRALDYLESREDVDSSRLGTMGMSGGGWETLWLSAIDNRIKVVNSGVYTTTMVRRMENRAADAEPDPEQDPFSFLSRGLDVGDIILAAASKGVPVSLAIMDKDFFPLDGALKTYREVKEISERCGLKGKITAKVFKGGHGSSPVERVLFAVSEISKTLIGREISSLPADFVPEKEEKLHATKNGIVLKALGGKTSAELNAVKALKLAHDRKPLSKKALKVKLAELLGVETRSRTGVTGKLPGKKAVILIGKRDKKFYKKLTAEENTVVCVTPVGMEQFKETYLDFVPLTEANLSYDAFLCGKTLSGMRVQNILSVVELLSKSGYSDITVQGEGYGALLALFAAALDKRVTTLVETKGLISLSSLCYNREYAWPVSVIVPGILKYMDLNDVRESILQRNVILDTPLDHVKRQLTQKGLQEEIL